MYRGRQEATRCAKMCVAVPIRTPTRARYAAAGFDIEELNAMLDDISYSLRA